MKKKITKYIALSVAIIFTATSLSWAGGVPVYSFRVPEKYGKVTQRWRAAQVKSKKEKGKSVGTNRIIAYPPSRCFDRLSIYGSCPELAEGGRYQGVEELSYSDSIIPIDNDGDEGMADKTVILIQDAHTSFEAQKNIGEIIKSMPPELYDYCKRPMLVCVEGAVGDIDLGQLHGFPLRDARDATAESFMQKGFFAGSEYAAITSDEPFRLRGVEDEKLFHKNFRMFYELALKKNGVLECFANLEKIVEKLKMISFSKELLVVDNAISAYRDRNTDIMQFVSTLFSYVYRNDLVELHQYPNLALFHDVLMKEQRLNFVKAKEEEQYLRTEIADSLGLYPEQYAAFLDYCGRYEKSELTPKEYAECLRGFAMKAKVDLSPYDVFLEYVEYLGAYGCIDMMRFVEEVERCAYVVAKALARSHDEKTLVDYDYALHTIRKLCSLEGTVQDVTFYRTYHSLCDIETIYGTLQRIAFTNNVEIDSIEDGIDLIANAVREAETFYAVAEERNKSLIENTLSAMDEEGTNVAMLIGGGYHTDGLVDELQKRDIDYCVVTPTISQLTNEIPYFEKMTGQLFPLLPHLVSCIAILTSYGAGNWDQFAEQFTYSAAAEALQKVFGNEVQRQTVLSEFEVLKKIHATVPWDAAAASITSLLGRSVSEKDAVSSNDILGLLKELEFLSEIQNALAFARLGNDDVEEVVFDSDRQKVSGDRQTSSDKAALFFGVLKSVDGLGSLKELCLRKNNGRDIPSMNLINKVSFSRFSRQSTLLDSNIEEELKKIESVPEDAYVYVAVHDFDENKKKGAVRFAMAKKKEVLRVNKDNEMVMLRAVLPISDKFEVIDDNDAKILFLQEMNSEYYSGENYVKLLFMGVHKSMRGDGAVFSFFQHFVSFLMQNYAGSFLQVEFIHVNAKRIFLHYFPEAKPISFYLGEPSETNRQIYRAVIPKERDFYFPKIGAMKLHSLLLLPILFGLLFFDAGVVLAQTIETVGSVTQVVGGMAEGGDAVSAFSSLLPVLGILSIGLLFAMVMGIGGAAEVVNVAEKIRVKRGHQSSVSREDQALWGDFLKQDSSWGMLRNLGIDPQKYVRKANAKIVNATVEKAIDKVVSMLRYAVDSGTSGDLGFLLNDGDEVRVKFETLRGSTFIFSVSVRDRDSENNFILALNAGSDSAHFFGADMNRVCAEWGVGLVSTHKFVKRDGRYAGLVKLESLTDQVSSDVISLFSARVVDDVASGMNWLPDPGILHSINWLGLLKDACIQKNDGRMIPSIHIDGYIDASNDKWVQQSSNANMVVQSLHDVSEDDYVYVLLRDINIEAKQGIWRSMIVKKRLLLIEDDRRKKPFLQTSFNIDVQKDVNLGDASILFLCDFSVDVEDARINVHLIQTGIHRSLEGRGLVYGAFANLAEFLQVNFPFSPIGVEIAHETMGRIFKKYFNDARPMKEYTEDPSWESPHIYAATIPEKENAGAVKTKIGPRGIILMDVKCQTVSSLGDLNSFGEQYPTVAFMLNDLLQNFPEGINGVHVITDDVPVAFRASEKMMQVHTDASGEKYLVTCADFLESAYRYYVDDANNGCEVLRAAALYAMQSDAEEKELSPVVVDFWHYYEGGVAVLANEILLERSVGDICNAFKRAYASGVALSPVVLLAEKEEYEDFYEQVMPMIRATNEYVGFDLVVLELVPWDADLTEYQDDVRDVVFLVSHEEDQEDLYSEGFQTLVCDPSNRSHMKVFISVLMALVKKMHEGFEVVEFSDAFLLLSDFGYVLDQSLIEQSIREAEKGHMVKIAA